MGHISYLCKRGSVYYARMDVPEDLHLALKTQTKKRSLGTKDEAEAKRRLWPVIAEWQREFEDVRSRRALVGMRRLRPIDFRVVFSRSGVGTQVYELAGESRTRSL